MTSRRKKRQTRRRYQAASVLTVGSAQVRLPAPSWRWVRWAVLGIVILLVTLSLWVLLDDRFYVYDARVQGVIRLSPEEVFWASDLPGLHVLWVKPRYVERQILTALPSLESAHVSCRLTAGCTIAVVERQPRVMWKDDGQVWWVDGDGVIFPAQGEAAEAWLVYGSLPRMEGQDDRLAESVRVALTELWGSGVEMEPVIYYTERRGLIITDERGWRVFLGRGPGMERRIRVLEAVAAHLTAQDVTPRFVDVRFPEAPYYSLTNDW